MTKRTIKLLQYTKGLNMKNFFYDSENRPVPKESIEGEFELGGGYYLESALYEDGTEVPPSELAYLEDAYSEELYGNAYQDYADSLEYGEPEEYEDR